MLAINFRQFMVGSGAAAAAASLLFSGCKPGTPASQGQADTVVVKQPVATNLTLLQSPAPSRAALALATLKNQLPANVYQALQNPAARDAFRSVIESATPDRNAVVLPLRGEGSSQEIVTLAQWLLNRARQPLIEVLERQAAYPDRRPMDRDLLLRQSAKLKQIAELKEDGTWGQKSELVFIPFQLGLNRCARRTPDGSVVLDFGDGSIAGTGKFGPATLLAIRELTKGDRKMGLVFAVFAEVPSVPSSPATASLSTNP